MSVVRTLIAGAVLAVTAVVMVVFGDALGLDLDRVVLIGASTGAVLGLVPGLSAPARAGGFLLGFVVGYVGYGIRAQFLPDTSSGRAVGAFLVIVLVTVLSVATLGRLPLWTLLLGVAAMAGSYEAIFLLSPSDFLAQSPIAATQALLAASFGFAATIWFGLPSEEGEPAMSMPVAPSMSSSSKEA